MIKWFCRQTIRFNLLVMFLGLSIIPLIFSITQNYYFQEHTFIKLSSSRLDGVALGHSKLVSEWFNDKLALVRSFANDPIFRKNNNQEIQELLLNIKNINPEFRNLSYIDLNGNPISKTSQGSSANVSDRPYFKSALLGKAVVSDILISKKYKDLIIVFSAPVKVAGKVKGVLVASVALDDLKKVVDVSYEGKTFNSYLMGDNGYYIVPPAAIEISNNQLLPIDKKRLSLIKTNNANRIEHLKEKNKKVLVALKRVSNVPATLVVQQDESEAVQGVGGQGLINNVFITFTLIFWIIPLAFWLSNRISRPLDSISTSVRMIALGDFSQRVVIPFANHEVRIIAEDINIMGEKLQEFQATIEQQMIEITLRNEELIKYQEINKKQMDELEAHKLILTAQNYDLLLAKTQLTESNKLLEDIANRDQLTGIKNRRFFTAKLYQTIHTSIQSGEDLCIAILDIDYFKSVNDTYGHKVGDQVLKQLANLIEKTIRDSDLVARFGGEEFIILASNTRKDGGQVMAEKVRSVVENYQFETDAGILRLTISIGVAYLSVCNQNNSAEQVEDCLLQIADKNLYLAKDLGRNRVVS